MHGEGRGGGGCGWMIGTRLTDGLWESIYISPPFTHATHQRGGEKGGYGRMIGKRLTECGTPGPHAHMQPTSMGMKRTTLMYWGPPVPFTHSTEMSAHCGSEWKQARGGGGRSEVRWGCTAVEEEEQEEGIWVGIGAGIGVAIDKEGRFLVISSAQSLHTPH